MRARVAGGLAILAALAGAGAARADEPLFGGVNTTDLLPKDRWQVEQWLTDRPGQAAGRHARLEGRSEAEVGLRDNLQATLYLNYDSAGGGGRFDGATAELIWRLTSPYLAPVGIAVLADTTLGPDQRTGRLRLIAQKNFRDDTLVLAANLWAELERRPAVTAGTGARPKVSSLELDLGASYRFRPRWSVALEYRRHADYAGYGLGGRSQYVADLAGPTLHYGARRWFFTLSALRQLHAEAHDPALRRIRWDELRLRIGRTF